VLDGRYWRELRGTIRRSRLGDRLEHLGEVSAAQKVKLLHSLSAFVQPSIKPEALGTASLEAQAAGVPVVAPDEGVFPEMLGLTGGGLLFAPGDSDALAGALAQLIEDKGRADAMGESAARAIERDFSAEAAASALEDVLAGVTSHVDEGGVEDGEETVQAGEEGRTEGDR